MYKVVVLSILLQPGFIHYFHEGEGNFKLYLDIINGVGGLQGIVLSLLWAIGGWYFTKSKKYLVPYFAFASLQSSKHNRKPTKSWLTRSSSGQVSPRLDRAGSRVQSTTMIASDRSSRKYLDDNVGPLDAG